jgi:2-oxoisovalerate dehydrogenase E2 component (dihydrolipoyl transacylase)
MSELRQFKLPDVGEGLTEADIVKWHVQPGDTVKVNQIIVEIETAKAVVELPSPHAGVVSGLLVNEGDTVDVGTPIISVDVTATAGSAAARGRARDKTSQEKTSQNEGAPPLEEPASLQPPTATDLIPPPPKDADDSGPGSAGAAAGGADSGAPAGNGGAPKEKRQAVLVGYGVKLGATTRRPRKPNTARRPPAGQPAAPAAGAAAEAATAAPAAPAPRGPAAAEPAGGAVLAKPPVRKLARDLGVDLASIAGTGPNGSITRDDVQSAVAVPAPATRPAGSMAPLSSLPREERVPVKGVRKHTAAAMTASAFTAPHVTMFLQIDITPTMEATARLKAMPDFEGIRVSPLLLVARALLVAAARHPMINSSWDEDAQEIVVRHYVNLGIAAATDRGLVVPNIKDAHALSLPDLARALGELAQTARAGKATPADLAGGTISITNVGVFGVDTGTPILPPGEAAILAFGQVKDAPWVHEGELAIRKVCTLGMSFDHRVVDGDLGSAVLRDVGAMLSDPLRMLAWS